MDKAGAPLRKPASKSSYKWTIEKQSFRKTEGVMTPFCFVNFEVAGRYLYAEAQPHFNCLQSPVGNRFG